MSVPFLMYRYSHQKGEKMLTQLQKDLMTLCKGLYQENLIRGIEAWSGASLRGKALKYKSRYMNSAGSLLSRIRKAGYEVDNKLVLIGKVGKRRWQRRVFVNGEML